MYIYIYIYYVLLFVPRMRLILAIFVPGPQPVLRVPFRARGLNFVVFPARATHDARCFSQ